MSRRPQIELVVTDLDNTLYDWVSYFVPSFYEMVNAAGAILNVSTELLLDDLQVVHRKHGNSEHPFALLETEIVRQTYPNASREELSQLLNDAFLVFNRTRKQTLKLYPGVYEAIQFISHRRTLLVAHTEAPSINALHRIRFLGLTPFFAGVYAPQSTGVKHPNIQQTNPLDRELRLLRPLHSQQRKPSPDILLEICKDWDVLPDRTLYIGDSLTRDIGMAKTAGTLSAWAKYGATHEPHLWQKLVRVTHWTNADVEREAALKHRFAGIQPDFELDELEAITGKVEFAAGQRQTVR